MLRHGPFNLSRRGEFACGDTRDRVFDQTRRSGESRSTAKSSTTKGPKPRKGNKGLPVSTNGDGAEPLKLVVDG